MPLETLEDKTSLVVEDIAEMRAILRLLAVAVEVLEEARAS